MVVLFLLAVALILIGRTTGSGWTMVIVSALIGVAVAGAVWPGLALRGVRADLSSPRDAVAGGSTELELRLGGSHTAVTVSASFVYPHGGEPACDPVGVETPARGGLVCKPPRRGVVSVVDLEIRCAAPLGLVWWRRHDRIALRPPLEVAPRPVPAGIPAISHGEGGDRHRPERRSGHDSVRTIRDYVPGDATRLVHWKATARRGQLTVKEMEDPEGALLAVVLDLRADMETGEKAASRAAGLCTEGLRRGMEVVLCTAEAEGPVSGRVSSPLAAGRRLARAVPGPPGTPPRSAKVVHLP